MWSASGSEGARARARAEDDCRGRGRDLDLDRSTNDRLGATLKENPFARVLLELVHRDPDVRSMDPQIAAVDLILRFRYVIVILCGGSPSLNFFDSLLASKFIFYLPNEWKMESFRPIGFFNLFSIESVPMLTSSACRLSVCRVVGEFCDLLLAA